MNKRITRHKNKRRILDEKIKTALANRLSRALGSHGYSDEHIKKLSQDSQRTKMGAIQKQKGRTFNQRKQHKKVYSSASKTPIVRTPYIQPNPVEFPIDDWFKTTQTIDVSIIVPMFKSSSKIEKQIAKWDVKPDGLNKEIIYVDDCCPEQSHFHVLKGWQRRKKDIKHGVGKIILHDTNGGFGSACNTGANFASGKYLIFLNADCIVTENWVKPMVELIESNPTIGIVGNLHLKDSRVDSAGSEWSWKSQSFQHIGRNTYHGNDIKSAFAFSNMPEDLKVPGERQMVTGACFLIPRNLFNNIQGFDTQYRIGYWEDSDLNMRVKDAGYKVFYTPESIIHHSLGHSRSGGHPFLGANRKLFQDRWITTGRMQSLCDKRKVPSKIKQNIHGKVVGCVIACNEEEFLEASVDSISQIVDEWCFVIGGNKFANKAGMCDEKGYPTDNTLAIAHKLAKKYNGRVIEPPGRCWKDKIEMRNAYVKFLQQGQWMFMLDGDEVYKPEQLWRVAELMKSYEVLIMQFWLFWNNVNTLGTGSWQQYPQERVVHWKKGFSYKNGNHLNVSDGKGNLVHSQYPCWRGKEKLFYHYSWVRPIEKLRQKLLYYKYQSGIDNQSYIDNIFLKWRTNPNSVRGKTHPKSGGDFAPFEGIHPIEVRKLISKGKLDF